jgi:hypothetical protein
MSTRLTSATRLAVPQGQETPTPGDAFDHRGVYGEVSAEDREENMSEATDRYEPSGRR